MQYYSQRTIDRIIKRLDTCIEKVREEMDNTAKELTRQVNEDCTGACSVVDNKEKADRLCELSNMSFAYTIAYNIVRDETNSAVLVNETRDIEE